MITTKSIHLPRNGILWLMVGVLGGFWAKHIVNNTKIPQSAVWLPAHMGNVGSNFVR